MQFEFATAARIIFGCGSVGRLGELAAELGRKALVVTGCERKTLENAIAQIESAGIQTIGFEVCSEPTIPMILEGLAFARENACDLVVSLGGGSAIDTGKAIAALASNPGDIFDYLEVVGHGQALTRPSLPFIAVPTTAGTGSEVTRNAVLGVPEQRVKVSLRGFSMLPRIALVDPELTYSLPPEITASTGLDALTQLIEPFVSNQANPLTDALCREGIRRAARSLAIAYHHGMDVAARQDMALASLFGGLALANAKLGAVHGFAAPLGGLFSASHGALCARLLPFVMHTNIQALRERRPEDVSLEKYAEIARLITGNDQAQPEDGAKWVGVLCEEFKIPPLAVYGLGRADFSGLIEKASKASSMKGNPIQLSYEEMESILFSAL